MTRHMPESLGKYVVIKAYVDANHAGNISGTDQQVSATHFSVGEVN